MIDRIGSGGGTRTPDTRIMIEPLFRDYSPPPAPPCTLKRLLPQSFSILKRLIALQLATLNHTDFGHPVLPTVKMASAEFLGLFARSALTLKADMPRLGTNVR